MTADVLSNVLQVVRLTSAVYFDLELSAPWAAEAPPSCDIAGIVMPGAQRVIEYHLIARGSCWGHAVGQEPMRLNEGDLIVFPQGDPHVLSSAPGLRHPPNVALFERGTMPLPLYYEFGGGGERTRVVCCFLGCDDRPYNPLLASLPPLIHLSATNPRPGVATAWLRSLFDIAVRESASRRPGRENMLARVSELMFVETIRGYLETLPDAQTGWLAGVRDPLVGRALTSLHAEPRRPWTVEHLARDVGASRSVLAERFTTMVGQPPMQYLALWRMQIASRAIRDGAAIAAAAESVGYESEAAFSRAFKKLVGQSPATWRKQAAAM
jgi:AraC-like DNA-binding protein